MTDAYVLTDMAGLHYWTGRDFLPVRVPSGPPSLITGTQEARLVDVSLEK